MSVKKKMKSIINFSGVLAVCLIVIIAVSYIKPDQNIEEKKNEAGKGMPVTVLETKPVTHAAEITALGEVMPTWQTIIRIQVNGRIKYISDKLHSGSLVKKGETLIKVERSAYELQHAEAANQLKAARTELLLEEQRVLEAEQNWKRSGVDGAPDSPLALRKPQLAAAQSAFDAASSALRHAVNQLAWTEVHAPFDGVIVSRSVNPGESLFAGDEVAVVYALESVEIGIQFDTSQWALLTEPLIGSSATLKDPEQNAQWQAAVIRDSLMLNRDSRLRTLYLQVKKPLEQMPPLLPGMFVRAELTGRKVTGLLCIPESALTKSGKVWFIDKENRLDPHRTEALFISRGKVFIHAPEKDIYRVAVSPNSSFISGLKIQPIDTGREN